jgi:hypothetical protein
MVASEEIIRRARIRDAEVYGSPDDAERRFRARYLPSQRHYRGTVRPAELADVVLDNDDPLSAGRTHAKLNAGARSATGATASSVRECHQTIPGTSR